MTQTTKQLNFLKSLIERDRDKYDAGCLASLGKIVEAEQLSFKQSSWLIDYMLNKKIELKPVVYLEPNETGKVEVVVKQKEVDYRSLFGQQKWNRVSGAVIEKRRELRGQLEDRLNQRLQFLKETYGGKHGRS